MTSDRQRRANLANAKSSTGPKTVPGRVRSAQNALRHGLNVSVLSDPALAPLAEAIALRIAGPNANPETLECARRIAEAQVDLNRVRNYRRRLIAGLLIDPNYRPQRALSEQLRLMKLIDRVERMRWAPPEVKEFLKMAQPPEGEAKFAAIVEERAAPLAAIDRYERRAWSRRKFARQF